MEHAMRVLTATAIAALLVLPAASAQAASPSEVPLLNTAVTWKNSSSPGMVMQFDPTHGVPGARTQTGLQITGRPNLSVSPEVNVVDAFGLGGYAQYDAERYDINRSGGFGPLAKGEPIGLYSFEPFDGVSDHTTAGMMAITTEAMVHDTHHGTGVAIGYTPNARSLRWAGIWISEGGTGGVSIGDVGGGSGVGPADLGEGTLHVHKSTVTGAHFSSDGPAPAVSGCGSNPGVSGTDNAGTVSVGGGTSCVVTFHDRWAKTPVCIVQVRNSATPVAYVSSLSTSALTISLSGRLTGVVSYICQGVGGV
jgi:hypothetical protein